MAARPIIVRGDYCGGAEIAGLQHWMTVGGKLAIVLGDHVTSHGDPPHSPDPRMVEGSSWFSINGIPVCRTGDHASCGHSAVGSQVWFQIS